MRDELFDRDFQAARHSLNAGVDDIARHTASSIRSAFETLNRITWSAPWQAASKRKPTGLA